MTASLETSKTFKMLSTEFKTKNRRRFKTTPATKAVSPPKLFRTTSFRRPTRRENAADWNVAKMLLPFLRSRLLDHHHHRINKPRLAHILVFKEKLTSCSAFQLHRISKKILWADVEKDFVWKKPFYFSVENLQRTNDAFLKKIMFKSEVIILMIIVFRPKSFLYDNLLTYLFCERDKRVSNWIYCRFRHI